MKYPKEQQQVFERFLKKIAPIIDIKNSNGHSLHFMCFQQHSEGQKHNWLYNTTEGLKRGYKLTEDEEAHKFFESDFEFELYPEGCNDSHVETMIKYTLKNIGLAKD
ncbi:hypothetical protein [Roseivirga spongicola]|uniref:hypothetical protein n=1 Tax=Roseivirga spongicola TaxID=333140 RepID=UPI002AC92FD6|nr:hypothetical protein [Roseivirga spongicola]WPZ08736.1 hypothetical protein T7867_10750 [Roseivirga spongicola]